MAIVGASDGKSYSPGHQTAKNPGKMAIPGVPDGKSYSPGHQTAKNPGKMAIPGSLMGNPAVVEDPYGLYTDSFID